MCAAFRSFTQQLHQNLKIILISIQIITQHEHSQQATSEHKNNGGYQEIETEKLQERDGCT